VGGLFAGLVSLLFEMLMAAVTRDPQAFLLPPRTIATLVLGSTALDPGVSLPMVLGLGFGIHLVISAILGALFGLAVSGIPAVGRSSAAVVVVASAYGLAIWIVNLFLIAPLMGGPRAAVQLEPAIQVIAHSVFFGTTLGLHLAQAIIAQPEPVPNW
jgi:hypothetical protein